MIKKGKKWISFSLVLTFICMLPVSAMPLTAVDGGQQTGLENPGSGPGFVESIGQKPALAEKKNILPYLLVGVGVAAAAAILFLFVLNKKYDVSGYWTGSETYSGTSYFRWFKFSGDKKSGVIEAINPFTFSVISTAAYVVDGKRITWSIDLFSFSGAFDSETAMKGDILLQGGKIGTFALSKSSSDLAAPPPAPACDIVGTWVFAFNRRGSIENMIIRFSGSKTSGEFEAEESAWMTGTYTVVNADVTLLTTDKPDVRFSGQFTAENTMAGSWCYLSEYWTWTARRHE